MIISLYIANKLVEEISVDVSGCKCYEERYDVIFRAKGWLLYKYRVSIAIVDTNWEIFAYAESKVDLPNGK